MVWLNRSTGMAFPIFIILLDVIITGWAIHTGYAVGDLYHYFEERRVVTYLSSFQLVALSILCWIIFEENRENGNDPAWRSPHFIWTLMAAGFLFLAFDEVLMVHEKIDFSLHRALQIRETAVTDRLDDLIVLVYGLIGLVLLGRYRKALARYAHVMPLVASGAFLFLLMVGLDMLTNRRDVILDRALHSWISVIEDTTKIAAECLFLMAAHRCWGLSTNRPRQKPG